jgi:hypothetical protein
LLEHPRVCRIGLNAREESVDRRVNERLQPESLLRRGCSRKFEELGLLPQRLESGNRVMSHGVV